MNIKKNLKKALNEAKYMVKPEDLTKVQPKLKDTDVVKVVDEAGKPKTFLADRHYTHFAILDGKIAEAWNYKGIDPEDLKTDRKHYFYVDLQDRYPDRKMKEFKILSRKALEKNGIDINDQNNWFIGNSEITTENKKNVVKVNLKLTDAGLSKFLKIPTFKNLLHPNQLKSLKAGDNVLDVNHYILGTLTRVTGYDSDNMSLDKVNGVSEASTPNPWAICTASVGREDKAKYERCVMDVKKQYGLTESVNEDYSSLSKKFFKLEKKLEQLQDSKEPVHPSIISKLESELDELRDKMAKASADEENGVKESSKLKVHTTEGDNVSNNYMFFQNLKTMKGAIEDMLEMNQSEVDKILSDGHGWALDHIATSADDVEEVYHFLENSMGGELPDEEYGSVHEINEAEYQGKDVKLGKPMRGDVKKYKVYVKNDKGNVVKVNFGDKNMEIKRDDPKRRKSFRARHGCDNPGPRWKAKYWSCKFWSSTPVSDLLGEKENPCWDGYEIVGTKQKDGKEVPNCVKIKESVKPRMSKNQLIETVLNKTKSKSRNTLTVREFIKETITESEGKNNFFIVDIDTGEIHNAFKTDKEFSDFIKKGGTMCDRCEFMDKEGFAAYLGGTYFKNEPKTLKSKLDLNGKMVDLNSIEVDGVDTNDAPDYVDSYVSYAEYVDGTPLSDKEIEMLERKYRGLAQEILFNRN